MSYQAAVIFIVYYFQERFSAANSINSSASALGSLFMPPLIQILIQIYGINGALRIIAAIMANGCVFSMLFRPSNVEQSRLATRYTKSEDQGRSGEHYDSIDDDGDDDDCDDDGDDGDGKKRSSSVIARRTFSQDLLDVFDITLFKKNIHFLFTSVIGGFLFGVSVSTERIFLVPYAIDVGVPPLRAAFLVSVFGIAGLLGRLATVFIPNDSPTSASRLAGFSHAVCGLSCLALTYTTTYGWIVALLLPFGICSGIGSALRVIVVKNSVAITEASGAIAWWSVSEGIGSLVGVYVAGK